LSTLTKPDFHDRDTYKWWVLLTVSLGSLTVALDNSILATCLPRLASVFRTDSSVIAWVNLAYYIMSQSLMLTLAKIGDAKGRQKAFMAGLAFYTLGLTGCALSQSVVQLIAFRAVQGVGAGTGYSLAMAIAVAVFPPEERGKALGILTGVNSVGLVAGPVLGGLILDALGWRAVFYTRIPMALSAFIMTWVIVKEQRSEENFDLDIKGSATLFGFLALLLLFLNFGGKRGFATAPVIALGGLAALFLALFLVSEKRASQPIVELGFFKIRLFSGATLSACIQTLSTSFVIFLVPFYLMEAFGSSGSIVGMFMALVAFPLLAISPITGRLSDRIGSTFLAALGMCVLCGSLFLLSHPGPHPTYLSVAIGVGMCGLSMAIFQPPNNSAAMSAVPRSALGTASAIVMVARQVGASGGIALGGALFSTYQAGALIRLVNAGIDPSTANRMAALAGFKGAMTVSLVIASVGVLSSLVRGRHQQDP